MPNDSKIILSNRLFVPAHLVDNDQLKRWHYTWEETVYEPKLNEFGDVVLNSKGEPETVKRKERKTMPGYREVFQPDGSSYISFPRGDLSKLQPFLRLGYQDRRPIRPLGFEIKMSPLTLQDQRWPDQRRCVEEYMKYGYGVIEGTTGSGKTIMGIGAVKRMGFTTLLVSTLKDGVSQWIREFYKHTNLRELEDKFGRQLIGAYNPRLHEPYPITVSTIQAFLHPSGREFLRVHRESFGMLAVDEVHTTVSPEYIKVIQYLNPFAYVGLTATIHRKDRRHLLLYDTVGPVVARGTAKQMPPTVYFITTGEEAPGWVYKGTYPPHYQWNVILSQLAKSAEREDLVLKTLYEDLDDNRTIACIAERRVFAKNIYSRLMQDGYRTVYVDGTTKAPIRERIYREFREGKYQVICAGKVLNALIDLPTLDCIHLLTPSNSKATSQQIYGRARRFLPGKRNPIIRYYVDKGGQLDGAFRTQKKLCKENGWEMEVVDHESARMLGINLWLRFGQ